MSPLIQDIWQAACSQQDETTVELVVARMAASYDVNIETPLNHVQS